MDIKQTYKLTDVANILQVTQRTLYNYIKGGQLKAIKVGREWRVTEEDLKAFLSTGTEPGYLEKLNK